MNQLRPIIDNHITYRSSARTRRSILIVPAPMHYAIRSDKSAVQPIGQVNRPTLRPPESKYNRSYLASCKAVYIIKNHMWRKEKQADTKLVSGVTHAMRQKAPHADFLQPILVACIVYEQCSCIRGTKTNSSSRHNLSASVKCAPIPTVHAPSNNCIRARKKEAVVGAPYCTMFSLISLQPPRSRNRASSLLLVSRPWRARYRPRPTARIRIRKRSVARNNTSLRVYKAVGAAGKIRIQSPHCLSWSKLSPLTSCC